MARKIKQIASISGFEDGSLENAYQPMIMALCDDGTLFLRDFTTENCKWTKINDVPQD